GQGQEPEYEHDRRPHGASRRPAAQRCLPGHEGTLDRLRGSRACPRRLHRLREPREWRRRPGRRGRRDIDPDDEAAASRTSARLPRRGSTPRGRDHRATGPARGRARLRGPAPLEPADQL
ncbi:MAG: hypothetical protein AVDCRST_MAG54-2941, partial [uncultured Actinomycetospora sp.]